MKITKEITDCLRARPERKIIIRFDPDNVELLPCNFVYDPALSTKVWILREVEVQNEDGSWTAYPSISCLKGFGDNKFLTVALIKLTGKKEISVCKHVQDLILMHAAEIAGIATAIV